MEISYRIADINDLKILSELSILMCSGENCGEHDEAFIKNGLQNPKMGLFLAFEGDKSIGFSHVYKRHEWVWTENEEGPFGYLETIFVRPEYRGKGFAKALTQMCENWSRENGCVEFASSCDLDNESSFAFHINIGFKETHRIIHFSKSL